MNTVIVYSSKAHLVYAGYSMFIIFKLNIL